MTDTQRGVAPSGRGEDSRRRILDAAAELMSERGYSGTSISTLVKRSGLPASSIYWHFGSKEGVLAAVMEDGCQRWFATLPRWRELEGPEDERARQMLDATSQALEDHPDFLRLMFLIALERREIDPASLEVVRRVRARARDGLRRVADRYVDDSDPGRAAAADVARLALAVADGLFVAHHVDPDDTDLTRLFGLLAAAVPAIVEAALARA